MNAEKHQPLGAGANKSFYDPHSRWVHKNADAPVLNGYQWGFGAAARWAAEAAINVTLTNWINTSKGAGPVHGLRRHSYTSSMIYSNKTKSARYSRGP